MKVIQTKRLSRGATLPTRGHTHDAGLDLYCAEDTPYKPGEIVLVPTHVAINIEPGYVGLVRDRSSVSKKGLKVTAGVVDAGYTGEVQVVLMNLSGQHGCITKGTKIAQVLIVPVSLPSVQEVASFEKTERGDKGFGSTGG